MVSQNYFKIQLQKKMTINSPLRNIILPKVEQLFELVSKVTATTQFEKLEAGVLHFFPISKSLNDLILPGLANDIYTPKYLDSLIELLSSPNFKDTIESLIGPIDVNSDKSSERFFKATTTLVELKITGITFEKDYLIDFLKISEMLEDEEQFTHWLSKLEEDLQLFVTDNPQFTQYLEIQKGKFVFNEAEDNLKAKKILSSFLYDWALNNNFNLEKTGKIHVFVNSTLFQSLLENRIIFKDAGAGSGHGAWAHALQFYYVTEQNKLNTFLKHHPAELYEYLGKPVSKAKQDLFQWYSPTPDKDTTAWNIFFDRLDSLDFRTPEIITTKILNAKDLGNNWQWPLLCESILRQELKTNRKENMQTKPVNDKTITYKNYVKK